MRKNEAPSILAASINSLGSDINDWRNKKTPKALVSAGRINAQWLSISPNERTRIKVGMMMTVAGTIKEERKVKKSASRPGKRSRAKANAAIEQVTSWAAVVMPAIFKLFQKKCRK